MRSKAFSYRINPIHAFPPRVPPPGPSPTVDREEMILRYAPLIKYVAQRLAMRLPPHISLDDLVSAGVIGFMDALNKYDPSKNVQFKTYAEFRIRGAMLDELRALDWVPRSIRQKATQLEKVHLALEKKRGGRVEDEEIAQELGLSMEEYHQLLNETKGVSLLDVESLKEKMSDLPDEDFFTLLMDEGSQDPFQHLSFKELKRTLAKALEGLSEKERQVVSLYYYEELTLKEIGEVLGYTESRICQIHTKAVLKLRSKIRGDWKGGS